MRGLRLQGFMDVVALPACLLVIDLHVERQREFALPKHGIKMGGERLENMLPGLLAGGEIASFPEPQHHVEEAEIGIAVGDGIVLAPDGADADAAERKD